MMLHETHKYKPKVGMGGASLGLMVDMQPACVWLLGIVLG